MAFSSLTAQQQAAIQQVQLLANPLQAQVGKLVQALQLLQTAMADPNFTGGMAALESTDLIPNPTSLAGAQSQPASDLTQIQSDTNAALATYNTAAEQAIRLRACGLNALVTA